MTPGAPDPTAAVRLALGAPEAILAAWDVTPLTAGWGAVERGGGVSRLRGTAVVDGQIRPWSLVLKQVPEPADPAARRPEHFAYWRREADACQSGLLDSLAGLTAPRCFGVEESDGRLRIYLEDVADEASRPWPLARYRDAARALGRLNGSFLAQRPVPSFPWLSRDWHRQVVATQASHFEQLAIRELHPAIQLEWPDDLRDAALFHWSRRDAYLDLLDTLPRTFCHRDAFARNLLWRQSPAGRLEVVALDWAFCGHGAIGEEVASLVTAGAILFEFPVARLEELEAECLEGYGAGLSDAGWLRPATLTSAGYRAAALLRYGLYVGSLDPPSEDDVARTELAWGAPMGEIARRMVAVRRHAFANGDRLLG